MGAKGGSPLASYAYTLGPSGNRTGVTELNGRTVTYTYDDLYRLTSETIAAAQGATFTCGTSQCGTVGYLYDPVGNRTSMTSTLGAVPAGLWNYDANDRLTTDTYDNDGNTVSSAGIQNVYDFENHLIQHGGITYQYDGDGNRVSKTIGGVTTDYLVDSTNPTGYAQVMEELQNGTVTRSYVWGLQLVSQTQTVNGAPATNYYGYDGHGSVRYLTDVTGAITDTYDYDAYGNLINQTGTTPNEFLFTGEQYDSDLGLYYNRARYLDVRTGRFWGMDDDAYGDDEDPLSLHKYLYASANPVNRIDPSGHDDMAGVGLDMTLDAISALPNFTMVLNVGLRVASTVSVLGVKFIAAEEGKKVRNGLAVLYNDSAGNCTIGYGHLVQYGRCNGTEPADFIQGISSQRALDLLSSDSLVAVAALQRDTIVPLKQQEFDALTSFIFNEGEGNYKRSDLLKTLNQGQYLLVPPLFLHFTRAGNDPNALSGRRQDESMLFESGMYVAHGKAIY